MDAYGVGPALEAAAQMLFQHSRRTGRTTRLIDILKPGDRVVFADQRERDRVMLMFADRLAEAGGRPVVDRGRHSVALPDWKSPTVFVYHAMRHADDIGALFEQPTPEGRTHFDHGFVETFYWLAIQSAGAVLRRWGDELSGYGEAHRNTRRAAQKLASAGWRPYPGDNRRSDDDGGTP